MHWLVASGCAKNCESDYHCGFVLNVCSSLTHGSIPMANSWMRYKTVSSNTYTLIHFWEIQSKNTLTFHRVYWKGACGENKINDFNFILANQTPIKLKEKINIWPVRALNCDLIDAWGRIHSKNPQVILLQPWFPIQTGDFISGWVLIQECLFPE